MGKLACASAFEAAAVSSGSLPWPRRPIHSAIGTVTATEPARTLAGRDFAAFIGAGVGTAQHGNVGGDGVVGCGSGVLRGCLSLSAGHGTATAVARDMAARKFLSTHGVGAATTLVPAAPWAASSFDMADVAHDPLLNPGRGLQSKVVKRLMESELGERTYRAKKVHESEVNSDKLMETYARAMEGKKEETPEIEAKEPPKHVPRPRPLFIVETKVPAGEGKGSGVADRTPNEHQRKLKAKRVLANDRVLADWLQDEGLSNVFPRKAMPQKEPMPGDDGKKTKGVDRIWPKYPPRPPFKPSDVDEAVQVGEVDPEARAAVNKAGRKSWEIEELKKKRSLEAASKDPHFGEPFGSQYTSTPHYECEGPSAATDCLKHGVPKSEPPVPFAVAPKIPAPESEVKKDPGSSEVLREVIEERKVLGSIAKAVPDLPAKRPKAKTLS